MNWYKKAKHNEEFDWEVVVNELRVQLGRSPTADEVQLEILERLKNDLYKEGPVHAVV